MEFLNEESEGHVHWLSEVTRSSSLKLGEKGKSLFELSQFETNVPACFILSSKLYDSFLKKANISGRIQFLLDSINFENFKSVEENSSKIRDLIFGFDFSSDVEKEIFEAYEILTSDNPNFEKISSLDSLSFSGESAFVSVRSSLVYNGISEDSFNGQQDSFLNVKGKRELILHIKKCFASLFSARAIYFRKKKNLDYTSFSIAVVVQKMVDSDKSGVIYSNGVGESILIESAFGLGEGISCGKITPDRYLVSKEIEILDKEISKKDLAFTRDSSGSQLIVKLKEEVSERQVLSDYEIARVAEIGYDLEKHFGYPVEVEFAIESKEIFVLQVRPFFSKEFPLKNFSGEEVFSGVPSSGGVSSGEIVFIKELSDLEKINASSVAVVDSLFSELIIPVQRAKGVVSCQGGFSSYLSILCRELEIPCVSGVKGCFDLIEEGEEVILDGNSGKVFRGNLEEEIFKPEEGGFKNVDEIKKTVLKTKIKSVIDSVSSNRLAVNTGVRRAGILKFEKEIALGGKHPFFFEKNKLYSEYAQLVFEKISSLGNGLEEVWVSLSDFGSVSFSNLEDSLSEKNPFLGSRGIRFGVSYPNLLRAEIKAIKKFFDSFSGSGGIMVPFLSDVSELNFVKKIILEEGLGERVRLGVFLQTPSSVQIIKEIYDEKIDLVLLDSVSFSKAVLACDFDSCGKDYSSFENPAVSRQIEYLLRFCRRNNLEVYVFLEELKDSFNSFLVDKEVSGVVISPEKYSFAYESFLNAEEKILRNTDKEPRMYELKKQEESF